MCEPGPDLGPNAAAGRCEPACETIHDHGADDTIFADCDHGIVITLPPKGRDPAN